MSSGACRALVAVLFTLVATTVMALPVAANSESLNELSTVTYTVHPADGTITVRMALNLKTYGTDWEAQQWGPIVVEKLAKPKVSGSFRLSDRRATLPGGQWQAVYLDTPKIDGGGARETVVVSYDLPASPTLKDSDKRVTPARVDGSYLYFCVPGQATDLGSVSVKIDGAAGWNLTQSGTVLEPTPTGFKLDRQDAPQDIFTCIEGTRDGRLAPGSFQGPADRQIILQAWQTEPGWLAAAEFNSEPALDEIHRFLGYDIPGDGPVTVRMSPSREIGGYASAHNSPGIVQLDEAGGTVDPQHELAHAWFGTDNFTDLWLREGMADWTASSMAQAVCAPANANASGLDLSEWQVIEPASPEDYEAIIAAQEAAACGIVSAVAARMSEAQWSEVIGSMLKGETKYIGSAGPETGTSTAVDYREWLDAVDERGLVPAGSDPAYASNLDDLDFAQDLLDEFGIPNSGPELIRRSEARQKYHQFLADAAPLGAPKAVRKDMDDWQFDRAIARLDKSYDVLNALVEANSKLPTTDLIAIVKPDFEAAPDEASLDAVREKAQALLEGANAVVEPLGELQAALPAGWIMPAAVNNAISEQRFDDIMASITPSIRAAREISAANTALPQAGLLEKYKVIFENTATVNKLNELADKALLENRDAQSAGKALGDLEAKVGDWQIPDAVTNPIEKGQIKTGITVIEDAIAVVEAAIEADAALPRAGLREEIRPLFEDAKTGAEMADLRAQVEKRRNDAVSVGNALSSLNTLLPSSWTIPAVVSDPVAEGNFAAAAPAARAAQKWIEAADEADKELPEMKVMSRIRDAFENAGSLEELEAGAALAEASRQAAAQVKNAMAKAAEPRDLLTEFGLWGVNIQPDLDEALAAAVAGDVDVAIKKSGLVISTLSNGASSGSLRLGGLIFFAIAVLGVLGLWVMLRRQAGPSWARSTKPHWIDKNDNQRLLGRGKDKDKKTK